MRHAHLRTFLKSTLPSLLLLLPMSAALAVTAPTRTTVSVAGADLSATVRTVAGAPVAAGTVDFLLPDGRSLGSAVVNANGTAALAHPTLPPGTPNFAGASVLAVTAAYHAPIPGPSAGPSVGPSADSSDTPATEPEFADSLSTPAAVPAPQASTATPDFTVTGAPTTVTAAPGAYGTSVLTISSVGGYTGAVQLSCANLPAQVICVFNPTQQTLAPDGSFVTTLQLQTQGPSGKASSSLLPLHPTLTLALALPGALFLLGLGRRKGLHLFALTLLIAGSALTITGCSQRYSYLKHPPPVAVGTPAGTYIITVAVDGNRGSSVIEHILPISLIVR